MWKAAFRGVFGHKLRLALTALAVVLGVGFITGTFVLTDTIERSFDNVFGENTGLMVFAGIALFVGSFIIFNAFSVVVAQRTREFALLKALGAGGRQIMAAVLVEALVVGVVASVIGLLAGFGIAAGLKALLGFFGADLASTNLVVVPRTAVIGLVVGTVVTLVSAIAPARKAARISPMEALRAGYSSSAQLSRKVMVVGALVVDAGIVALMVGLFVDVEQKLWLVGTGAVLIVFGLAAVAPLFAGTVAKVIGAPFSRMGVPGRLAQRNSMRLPRRTAATAAALVVGLALVGAVSVFADSVKASAEQVAQESSLADFTVGAGSTFGSPSGMSPAAAEQFHSISILDEAESREQTVSQINQLLGLVTALLGLALIIAVLGITNTLALSVFERTRELGLLRAVGMARKQTRSMIRVESVIIAMMGAVVGLAIGVFLGWALVTALDEQGISTLSIPAVQLVVYVVGAGFAGVLAAVLPARRAARLDVLDAIAQE